MTFLLVHLSDLHFRACAADNFILTRAEPLVRAITGLREQPAACYLVVSGDIAYSGKPAEYAHARAFVNSIIEPICRHFLPRPTGLVVVPGNHDCDFANRDQADLEVLDSIEPDQHVDESVFQQFLSVQQPFQEFMHSLISGLDPCLIDPEHAAYPTSPASLDYRHTFRVDSYTVTFHLLNTAWSSRLHETQGALRFPHQLFRQSRSSQLPSTLTISVLHHPYLWFPPPTARSLRDYLESDSDVIMTGHEHETASYGVTYDQQTRTEYLEGGVLQDSNNPDYSSFNVVTLDIDGQTQTCHTFSWNPTEEYYSAGLITAARPFRRNMRRRSSEFPFTHTFARQLDEPGANFRHPRKKDLILADLFIYPSLRDIQRDEDIDEPRHIAGNMVVSTILQHKNVLIIGGDKSGKTALAKTLVKDLRQHGTLPILLNGRKLRASEKKAVDRLLSQMVKEQYGDGIVERYWQLDAAERAIVIDDYHLLPLNSHFKNCVLERLSNTFGLVVVLAGDEIRFEELSKNRQSGMSLWDLKHMEILELGHALRSQLISNWHSLGIGAAVPDGELQQNCRRSEEQINTLLGEHFMPAYALFVLVALQTLEIQDPIATTNRSVGYLYEALIILCLRESATRESDIDTNKNYLAEFAWHLFSQEFPRVPIEELARWHRKYCDDYQVEMAFDKQIESLLRSGMLEDHNGSCQFKYPYLYYFFVATYLARHMDEECETIRKLCTYLHQQDGANIVLFLCHLSRDPRILLAVMESADRLFTRYEPCDLDGDVAFLNELVTDVEELQLPDDDPEARRRKLLEDADEEEQSRGNDFETTELATLSIRESCELERLNDQLQLNSALKTIQIIGQILANHAGSMRGDVKKQLVAKSYSLGLRAMKCLFTVMKENINDLVEAIVDALRRRQGGIPNDRTRQSVGESLWGTLHLGTFAIVKYISGSVGMDRISRTLQEVLEENRTMPLEVIDLAVRLDHYRGFPEKETIDLAGKVHRNVFVFSLVRSLVFSKVFLFPVDYRIRQRIGNKLRISDTGQKRLIVQQSTKQSRPNRREGR